jgi:hypothetical protein
LSICSWLSGPKLWPITSLAEKLTVRMSVAASLPRSWPRIAASAMSSSTSSAKGVRRRSS